jgi:hypothetical protein
VQILCSLHHVSRMRNLQLKSIIISCHLQSSKCKLLINHGAVNLRPFCAVVPRCFTKLLMLKTTHKKGLQNIQEFVRLIWTLCSRGVEKRSRSILKLKRVLSIRHGIIFDVAPGYRIKGLVTSTVIN